MKLPFKIVPYLIILVLLVVITCQNGRKVPAPTEVIKVDTVYKYIEVHDTVPGKTVYISSTDSITWINHEDYIPKLTYDSLLAQYTSLGNSLFKTNVFETKFEIQNYGYVTVKDTISKNWLKSSVLYSNLRIPEKIVTITERELPKRQVYLGIILTGTKADLLNSASLGALYKDKRDRLYGGSIGITPQGTQYGVASYLKLKIKK